MGKLLNYWQLHPLKSIIILALVLRLGAVVFSKGYGMHDDHFLVIEAAQSWVDNVDYNDWLPRYQADPKPQGHSFTYAGVHFMLFYLMKLCGLTDPQWKMFIIRLLHALFSMITVIFGYRIAQKTGGQKSAGITGLLLAALWFMPFLSVRNLVEVTSIPFLMLGLWYLYNLENKKHMLFMCFLAGVVIGISFSFRFQTLIFSGGIGLALLFMKKWKETIFYAIGVFISICLLQGITDMMIWGKPFMELREYIVYNIQYREAYGNNNYLMYFLLLGGIIIPPAGLFYMFGFFRSWKKYLMIFLPVFLFLVFHTFFPNKQERFVLTVIPFYLIAGVSGWTDFIVNSGFEYSYKKLIRYSNTFFWIVNIVLLVFVTTTYSKKARIESMIYLSGFQNIRCLMLEESNHGRTFMMPDFYLQQWVPYYELQKINDSIPDSSLSVSKHGSLIYSPLYFNGENHSDLPEFVLFLGNENLKSRLKTCEAVLGRLQPEKIIEPGFVDKIMYWLNPANRNETIFIYRTKYYNGNQANEKL